MASTRRLGSRTLGALAIAVFLGAPITALRAQDFNPVIARVNGVDIRQSDLAFAEEEIGGNMPAMPPEQKREYLITYLADVVLGAQAAEQQKIGDLAFAEEEIGGNMPAMPPEQKREYLITYLADVVLLSQAAEQQKIGDLAIVKRQLAFAHNRVLMEALLQTVGDAAVTDEAMHKVYDEAVKQMTNEEEVHARHILVATEEEAKAIIAELKKGADFATLAKERSKDPGAAQGGDLGYFTKEQMVPEFAEAAFKLEKGQISGPVKTQFGWHVIKVEDRRIKPTPTFDQVKGQLENYVAHRAQAELIDNLRKSAKIERLDQPAAPDPSLNPAAPAKK